MGEDRYKNWVEIGPSSDEDQIWNDHVRPHLDGLPENIRGIVAYGCTEILNNVIDHSGSTRVVVDLRRSPARVALQIGDFGVGIFRKIQHAAGLPDEHAAFLELAKGRFTTDPSRHTGEGIFFTARMFDRFKILSGTMYVSFSSGGEDWLLEDPSLEPRPDQGTFIEMEISPDSERTTKQVFDRFAPRRGDEMSEITRTRLAIKLAQPRGEPLVSRSQAKRILARLEQFEEAILDFGGVPEIGPAFADEIFRVFASAHPRVRLIPVGANEDVMRMILRAQDRISGSTGASQ
jgi:anti-sigma regulatory factor (Ser/Thr protein kinase)